MLLNKVREMQSSQLWNEKEYGPHKNDNDVYQNCIGIHLNLNIYADISSNSQDISY